MGLTVWTNCSQGNQRERTGAWNEIFKGTISRKNKKKDEGGKYLGNGRWNQKRKDLYQSSETPESA